MKDTTQKEEEPWTEENVTCVMWLFENIINNKTRKERTKTMKAEQ